MAASLGTSVLELSTDNSKYDAGIKSAEGGLAGLRDKVNLLHDSLEILKMGFEFFKSVGEYVGDWISAAAEAELATTKLEAALKSSGQAGHGTEDSLKGLASELQRVTRFSAQAVMNTETLFLQFGVGRNDIERMTRAALDLSSALGIDLHSATMLLAKASEGNTASLARYGIQVDSTKTSAEQLAEALGQIEQRFGGAAVAEGDTFTGMLDRMKNAFGDVKEALGDAIIQSPVLRSIIRSLSGDYDDLASWIRGSTKAVTEFVDYALTKAVNSIRDFIGWLRALAQEAGFTALVAGLTAVQGALSGMLGAAQNAGEKTIKTIKDVDGTWHAVAVSVANSPLTPTAETTSMDTQFGIWADQMTAFLIDLGKTLGNVLMDHMGAAAKAGMQKIVWGWMQILSDPANTLFAIVHMFMSGSAKLPFTDYLQSYAPGVLKGFTDSANAGILTLETHLTEMVGKAKEAYGSATAAGQSSLGAGQAMPTPTQYRTPQDAYNAGAPGSGYAYTPYGQGGGNYWGTTGKYWASGFEGTIDRPTTATFGESGPEYVSVSPGSGKPGGGDTEILDAIRRGVEHMAAAWSDPGSAARRSNYQAELRAYATGARGAAY